jgi:hypothetical protein
MYTVRGKNYESPTEACFKLGVEHHDVLKYSNKGYGMNESIELALQDKENESFIVDGVDYKTLSNGCKLLKVSEACVLRYYVEEGLSPQEAVYKAKANNETGFYMHDVDYGSITNACIHYGVNYNTVRRYVRDKGLTEQEAIRAVADKHSFVVFGVNYKTKTNACKKLGVKQRQLNSLLKQGYSINSAFDVLLGVENHKVLEESFEKKVARLFRDMIFSLDLDMAELGGGKITDTDFSIIYKDILQVMLIGDENITTRTMLKDDNLSDSVTCTFQNKTLSESHKELKKVLESKGIKSLNFNVASLNKSSAIYANLDVKILFFTYNNSQFFVLVDGNKFLLEQLKG